MIKHSKLYKLRQRKKPKPTAEEVIADIFKNGLHCDEYGLKIWGKTSLNEHRDNINVLDVRGWGFYTGCGMGALGLDEETGIAIQKGVQQEVTKRVNQYDTLKEKADLLDEIASYSHGYVFKNLVNDLVNKRCVGFCINSGSSNVLCYGCVEREIGKLLQKAKKLTPQERANE